MLELGAASTGNNPQNTTGTEGLNPGNDSVAGLLFVGDRVADVGIGDLLDARGDKAHFAGAEFAGFDFLRRENADTVDIAHRARRHETDFLALPDRRHRPRAQE